MDEPKTKLLCNTGINENFRIPGVDGTWRRTIITKKARGPKQYLVYGGVKGANDIEARYVPASTRVEMIEKGA